MRDLVKRRERHKKYINNRYRNDIEYRTKHIAYQAVVRAKLKVELRSIIDEIRKRPCLDCGKNYPPYVLEFDHRPGKTKKFNIASGTGIGSVSMLMTELAKCDLVCANCHRTRTWLRKQQTGRKIKPQ